MHWQQHWLTGNVVGLEHLNCRLQKVLAVVRMNSIRNLLMISHQDQELDRSWVGPEDVYNSLI